MPDKSTACMQLVSDLLNPEMFGYACSREVRDAARRALGIIAPNASLEAPNAPVPASSSRDSHFYLAGWNGCILAVNAEEHFQKAQASAQQCTATPTADAPVALLEPVAYLHPKGTCATTDLWYKEAGWLPLFTEPQFHTLPVGVSAPTAQAMDPTDEQLLTLWQNLPAQGDPTGQRFAIAFARAVLALQGPHSAPQVQADARDGLPLYNSRAPQLDSRLVRRLRCSALDLADPDIRADATRLEQERNSAIKRLAPYIEDLIALAWAQAQSSGASSDSSKEAP